MTDKPETRSEHTVLINGVEHTVLMTDKEAKEAGASKVETSTTAGDPEAKSADTANKARAVRNK